MLKASIFLNLVLLVLLLAKCKPKVPNESKTSISTENTSHGTLAPRACIGE